MIKDLPKVPNNKVTVTHLTAMPTRRFMLIFLTWRMRFVRIKRRDVKIWSGGVEPLVFAPNCTRPNCDTCECRVQTPMIQQAILLEALVVMVDDGRAFKACGKA
jgi:hypothetical protein